jgi:sterol desaturase/sphingolipid hydroxylase (fatty acid hydroxylase superfamily)
MTSFVTTHETILRLAAFASILAVMMLWEIASPRRRRDIPRLLRWSGNLGIVALDNVLVRLLFPVTVAAFAATLHRNGHGLLGLVTWPDWLEVMVALIALDLAIYLQHVLFHAVPGLWRLHRMHHADLEFDTTTGLRFHPVEILMSMGIKFSIVAALGTPALAVVLFEILLNGTSLFNHGNVSMPKPLDRVLRWIVVTPDMHRVHHSIIPAETNSNFGFNLPWWDRLFGTYREQPQEGHQGMTIGIEAFRSEGDLRLDRMLWQPFRRAERDYSINRDS